jgi:hypothetical protein
MTIKRRRRRVPILGSTGTLNELIAVQRAAKEYGTLKMVVFHV